jgi:glycosyltransferase involved in cell wall biosynthesis
MTVSLIIQIPCFNEEQQLEASVAAIRASIASPPSASLAQLVSWRILVIDDGSRDGTATLAERIGIDHVVRHGVNRGLAAAFQTGLSHALQLGADIIVNTDADNQYDARDIWALVEPILAHQADIVIGARPIAAHREFSSGKKLFQRLGSRVVRAVSRTDVLDAPSGFRAISRHAAARINIYDQYTYTLESIIQAGLCGLVVISVPIRVNPSVRHSRLVRSNADYILRSSRTIFRTLLLYRAEKITLWPAVALFGGSGLLFLRWLVLWLADSPRSHVPSLVAAAVMFLTAVQLVAISYVSLLSGINRRLSEQLLAVERERRSPAGSSGAPGPEGF